MNKDEIMGAAIAAGVDEISIGKIAKHLYGSRAEIAPSATPEVVSIAKGDSLRRRCNPENGIYVTSPKMRPFFVKLRTASLSAPVEGEIDKIAETAGWVEGRKSGLAAGLVEAESRGNDLIRVSATWPDADRKRGKIYRIEAVGAGDPVAAPSAAPLRTPRKKTPSDSTRYLDDHVAPFIMRSAERKITGTVHELVAQVPWPFAETTPGYGRALGSKFGEMIPGKSTAKSGVYVSHREYLSEHGKKNFVRYTLGLKASR